MKLRNENDLSKKVSFIFVNCCMSLHIYPVNNWKVVRFLSICKTPVKTFVVQILVVLGNYDMFLQMLQYLDFIRLIWVEVNGKF